MKTIQDINFKDKKALIRVDFNVPLNNELVVTDATRIEAAKPTIVKILQDGGSCVLLSHLGRPKNKELEFSLQHIVEAASTVLGVHVLFAPDCVGDIAETAVANLKPGEVLLLENVRYYKEETAGDSGFAKKLSKLGDIYVNDAFGSAHRAHASTSVIANYFPNNKYFGLLLSNEINSLETALKNPKRPFTAIIGGAKITGKIDVITSLFDKVDNLIIGGGMAYTFAKAMGGNIGNSLVEDDKVALAKSLITAAKAKGVQLLLPSDSVNAKEFNNNAIIQHSEITNIPDGFMGLDIGSDSITHFSKVILNSKTIIWNGPMGVFEMDNFSNGTKQIGETICKATQNGAFSLVGGGDSVAAVKQFGFAEKVSYISTGGGAMLEYLEGKQLPGVTAIQD